MLAQSDGNFQRDDYIAGRNVVNNFSLQFSLTDQETVLQSITTRGLAVAVRSSRRLIIFQCAG
jgi:hypothetical protein